MIFTFFLLFCIVWICFLPIVFTKIGDLMEYLGSVNV